ncbi:DUF1801 domain-containing protein [Aquimarina hainanensis]|uniref:DUF1801 domain-containing protein n=1 Tax=Aquimarina hainanensis TaxID=1578017 RepID=A0ABW5N692_9FLAO|nr:DUF1801 domain-containing protein [Aquimarina sp. TRL1]QKX06075.1 DUF1801 domain-containing protein [Aquimarina sp. TRL1]
MKNVQLITSPQVAAVFDAYPDNIRPKIENLRNLILETANELTMITQLEETLKWGEPSYITKTGSTIRINWKAKKPDQYAMYFQCTSKLVPTFKLVYKNTFSFEGNRALVFALHTPIPVTALKKCIGAALTYHKVKQLPLLGM